MPKRKRSITGNSVKYKMRLRRQQESAQQAANRRQVNAACQQERRQLESKYNWAKSCQFYWYIRIARYISFLKFNIGKSFWNQEIFIRTCNEITTLRLLKPNNSANLKEYYITLIIRDLGVYKHAVPTTWVPATRATKPSLGWPGCWPVGKGIHWQKIKVSIKCKSPILRLHPCNDGYIKLV